MTLADPVAEFLAHGGRIIRCPTAAVVETEATVSADDRARLAAHAARLSEASRVRARVFLLVRRAGLTNG